MLTSPLVYTSSTCHIKTRHMINMAIVCADHRSIFGPCGFQTVNCACIQPKHVYFAYAYRWNLHMPQDRICISRPILVAYTCRQDLHMPADKICTGLQTGFAYACRQNLHMPADRISICLQIGLAYAYR